jgi:hypothetical protein
MSSGVEDENDDSKEVLLKNLKKMHSKFMDAPDTNILGNCLIAVVFAKNDEILTEQYADKLIIWVSKWSSEKTPIPPEDDEFEMFTSETKLGDGRFAFQGNFYNVNDFNSVVPLEFRERLLNLVSVALNKDKKAESISLMKVQPTTVFTGDIPDILQVIDISNRPKKT